MNEQPSLNGNSIEVELAVVVTKLDDISKTIKHIDSTIDRQESRLDNVEQFTKTAKTIISILAWVVPLSLAFVPIVFHFYVEYTVEQKIKHVLDERGL